MVTLSSLLEKVYKFVKEVLKLAEATERNRSDILETQKQLAELNEAVRRLAYEIKRVNDRELDEQEKAQLRMDKLKLEIERLLLEARLEDRETRADEKRKKLTE
ncbi:MAG TPA: hypothetical protein VN256_08620 [Pyrinomonadaceae bacterium]|nr:hypothetical protein [Pyrinomonadaceae bacterium]